MNIVFFESKGLDQEKVRKELYGNDLVFTDLSLNSGCAADFSQAEIISVFVNSKIDKQVLELMPKLKFIAARSTGFDHIDVASAALKQVKIANVPHYGENTVAEHTFSLILALSRNIHKSYLKVKNDDFDFSDLAGFDLKGKILGIVGAGSIGMHVIRIARGFGMNVVAYSRTKDTFLAEVMGFHYADSLDDLLKVSDIVSLHVPLTDQTRHLINEEKLELMKPTAFLINTARGEIVDTDALYEALKSGRIGGAGLDVIEGEEYIGEDIELKYSQTDHETIARVFRDKEILKMENVVFTPHIAFFSREASERLFTENLKNIQMYLFGSPINLISA